MKKPILILLAIISLSLNAKYISNKILFHPPIPVASPPSKPNPFNLSRRSEFDQLRIDSNDIVFVGNSLTELFELSEFFGRLDIKNRGIANDITDSVYIRMGSVLAGHPKKVFLEVGINDLLHNKSVDSTFYNIERIVNLIRGSSPGTKIVITSLLPTDWSIGDSDKKVLPLIVQLNVKLKSMSDKKSLLFIDLYSELVRDNGLSPQYDCGDGLHLNGRGYVIWKNKIDSLL